MTKEEINKDIELFNELLYPILLPKLTYEKMCELMEHDDIMHIVNETFWKLMTNNLKRVYVEYDLQCVSVYFSNVDDLFGSDNNYRQDVDYECATYDYKQGVIE